MVSPLDQLDSSHRMGLLLNYVRKEGPGWVPGLRQNLRAPVNWLMNGLGPMGQMFGHDALDDAGGDDRWGDAWLSSVMSPLSSLLRTPSVHESQAFWVTPGYHHKGFLPFHDVMLMSFNLREHFLDDRLQFDLRPFYGQNWLSANGYGGAQLSVNLGKSGAAPWGSLALRYSDGASNLMDTSRGFDMTAALRFDEHLSLNAGVNGERDTELGNYVMLRWRAEFGR